MRIKKESFGKTIEGQEVTAFLLENANGVRIKVINYGATVVSVEVPDRNGKLSDVLLGFDGIEGYQGASNPYFGATCGRCANRIAKGRFTLDGTEHSLATNIGEDALHGGLVGFDKKIWDAEIIGNNAVKMTLSSPDGEEGYPGTLQVELLFSLSENNELQLEYRAKTDRKTVLNLTNHSYFNLAGGGSIHDHVIQINATHYTEVDSDAIPTGKLCAVAGTEMDLRTPIPIGKNIDQVQGLGYDHNYCITPAPSGEPVLVATVVEPESGRMLECLSTEPGVQFYTGNYLQNISGKGGATYNRQEGFCLETQHYPDSPNQPSFPSIELAPGETYSQTCIYRFGVVA